MISYISGTIKNIDEKSTTILTNSGVGYKIYLPINTLFSLSENENIELLIHTIVKDDAIDLYGFINKNELKIFEKLITVSGVGPKSALNILSISSIENIVRAVENNDANILSGIPGLGKKTCEKIIIELKGKLKDFSHIKNINKNIDEDDARLALISLGYNDKDISLALKKVKENQNKSDKDFEKMQTNEIIKDALKYLR